jgi:hypothetical protein
LDGELRTEPQHNARGQLFRWELRDVDAQRVFYGTSTGDLLATQSPDYPATERPLASDLAAQLAARHDYAVELATVMQSAYNRHFEEQHGHGAIGRLPRPIAAALLTDKGRWSGIRSWRRDLPTLVIPESSILAADRAALIPRGNVTIIRDLDELGLLDSIASAHRWQLVDRFGDDAEALW